MVWPLLYGVDRIYIERWNSNDAEAFGRHALAGCEEWVPADRKQKKPALSKAGLGCQRVQGGEY